MPDEMTAFEATIVLFGTWALLGLAVVVAVWAWRKWKR